MYKCEPAFAMSITYHIISYHIISYHIISYHIISYHIISYHIISHHITSHHITSHHIISYDIITSGYSFSALGGILSAHDAESHKPTFQRDGGRQGTAIFFWLPSTTKLHERQLVEALWMLPIKLNLVYLDSFSCTKLYIYI